MQNLIGTKMLRAYMHGFFVDNRLYGKAKAIAEPFSYDEYRARKVEEKLAEERATRITVKKKLPKVNAALAARLEKAAEEEGGKDGKKKRSRDSGAGAATRRDEESDGEDAADAGAREGGLLKDDRFAAMFKDSAFEVDEDSETYRMLHPNAPKLTKREREEMLEEHFDLESEDEDEDAEEEEDEGGGGGRRGGARGAAPFGGGGEGEDVRGEGRAARLGVPRGAAGRLLDADLGGARRAAGGDVG
jgi:ribosome biogenesis protein ENP2